MRLWNRDSSFASGGSARRRRIESSDPCGRSCWLGCQSRRRRIWKGPPLKMAFRSTLWASSLGLRRNYLIRTVDNLSITNRRSVGLPYARIDRPFLSEYRLHGTLDLMHPVSRSLREKSESVARSRLVGSDRDCSRLTGHPEVTELLPACRR